MTHKDMCVNTKQLEQALDKLRLGLKEEIGNELNSHRNHVRKQRDVLKESINKEIRQMRTNCTTHTKNEAVLEVKVDNLSKDVQKIQTTLTRLNWLILMAVVVAVLKLVIID